MNTLILPAITLLIAFLFSLFLSKKNKDGLSAMLLILFGAEWAALMAIMLYNDVIISQEWWKFVILIGILISLILAESLEVFGKISYTRQS